MSKVQIVKGQDKEWEQCTKQERFAASSLGWTQETWDQTPRDDAPLAKEWSGFSEQEQSALKLLGYTKADVQEALEKKKKALLDSESSSSSLPSSSSSEEWPTEKKMVINTAAGGGALGTSRFLDVTNKAIRTTAVKKKGAVGDSSLQESSDYRHRLVKWRADAADRKAQHLMMEDVKAEKKFLEKQRERKVKEDTAIDKHAVDAGLEAKMAEVRAKMRVKVEQATSQHETRTLMASQYAAALKIQQRYRVRQAKDIAAYKRLPEDQRANNKPAFANRKAFKVQIVGASNLKSVGNQDGRIDPYCVCFVPGKPISECTTAAFNDEPNPYWGTEKTIKGHRRGDPLEFAIYNAWEDEKAKEKKEKDDDDLVTRKHKGEIIGRCRITAHDDKDGCHIELPLQGASKRQKRVCKLHVKIMNNELEGLEKELAELKAEQAQLEDELQAEMEIEAVYLQMASARERREQAIVMSQAKSSVPEHMALKRQEENRSGARLGSEAIGRCKECHTETKVWKCSCCSEIACVGHSQRCVCCKVLYCTQCIQRRGLIKRVGAVFRCNQCTQYLGKGGGKGAKRFP
eukprot:TRINITY_DN3250_c0_g1_i1.p1 TRINITY_DN3250_c0_g1~~TRINITY_DN3250_c0_g1_i1.p1  ORF type:complete len:574 (+),score=165.32 TRINITY_DN3250_c0_g1_i1:200-1921(+)